MTDTAGASEAQPLRAPAVRSARCFAIGLACGAFALWAATSALGDVAAARALSVAGPLVRWRIALMGALPLWLALFISNGMSVVLVMAAGPLGCMAEVWLQRRSPLYARLCRSTSRSGSLLNRLDRRIAQLGETAGRDGVAVAFLVPLAFLFVNGFVMGAVVVVYVRATEPGLLGFVASVAPHGVVELPALILTGAAGLVSAGVLADAARAGADLRAYAVARLRSPALRAQAARVLALLLVAAVIEGTVSVRTAEMVAPAVFESP